MHDSTTTDEDLLRSQGRRSVLWGGFILVGGAAMFAAAIHLVEVRRQGPLPSSYNAIFLAVGLLSFIAGLMTSFAHLKQGVRWFRAARESREDQPRLPGFSRSLDNELELSVLKPSDARAFFELHSANRRFLSDWLTYDPKLETREGTVQRLRELHQAHCDGTIVPVAMWQDGRLVGVLGLGSIDHQRRSAELSYWIDEEYQGRGIVTRSCCAVLSYAFEELRLRRVVIRCEPKNMRSRAVAERLGFTHEGTLRQCERKDEELIDLRIYAMLQGDHADLDGESAT